jgi:hypothetical protein
MNSTMRCPIIPWVTGNFGYLLLVDRVSPGRTICFVPMKCFAELSTSRKLGNVRPQLEYIFIDFLTALTYARIGFKRQNALSKFLDISKMILLGIYRPRCELDHGEFGFQSFEPGNRIGVSAKLCLRTQSLQTSDYQASR